MKKLLYIFSAILLIASCVEAIDEPQTVNPDEGKVVVDFSVVVPDARPATKAMGEIPQLKNLYLAVFDEAGYLAEYVKADPVDLATQNGTEYTYSATISLSPTPRIIHWIGNAPANVQYGSEESVLMSIKSTKDEDLYWYRKVVPTIDGVEMNDVVQPTRETLDALDNIPLIRNFAKIVLENKAEDFELESFAVVNTLNTGLAAAYDFSKGVFVDYMNEGAPKTYETLIQEGYNASTPAISNYVSATEAWAKAANAGSAFYVYEREKPIETPAYIIASGKYNGGAETVYYKIDLRDENGEYFPLLRNFQYTINLNSVKRDGYKSISEAANSGGSGDVSTSLETESLIYMSDGTASLEVGYTAIVVTSADPVDLSFAFYPDLQGLFTGPGSSVANAFSASVEFIINDDAGISGAAIQAIGEPDYTFRPYPRVYITPTTPEETPKTQSITVLAKYKDANGIERSLQRKVRYTVMDKQLLTAECVPSEVATEQGTAFELHISIPGGLSSGMFPLDLNIEAEAMSIVPDSALDHMPVSTGKSITGSGKASYSFVKTLTWAEYDQLENVEGRKTLVTYFKTSKDASATKIFVANPQYFYGMVDGAEQDYAVADLGNFTPQHFTNLAYNPSTIPAGRNNEVTFSFRMSAKPEDGKVVLTMTGVAPSDEETSLTRIGTSGNAVQYEYTPAANMTANTNHSFQLVTTTVGENPQITLSAYHFVDASASAERNLNTFNGSFDKGSLGVDAIETVDYTFNLPTYTEGMTVKVTLVGLEPTADDSRFVKVSGNVYSGAVYTYTPTAGGSQTVTLATVDTDEKECSIKLEAEGYSTETDTIWQIGTIVIPAGNLQLPGDYEYFIYASDPEINNNVTAITSFDDIRSQQVWFTTNYYNASDIELNGVSMDSTIYIRFVIRYGSTNYYRDASVKVSDAVSGQVDLSNSFDW